MKFFTLKRSAADEGAGEHIGTLSEKILRSEKAEKAPHNSSQSNILTYNRFQCLSQNVDLLLAGKDALHEHNNSSITSINIDNNNESSSSRAEDERADNSENTVTHRERRPPPIYLAIKILNAQFAKNLKESTFQT